MREAKYRHELKFQISFMQYQELHDRLILFMKHDIHAMGDDYMIRSLYFDDMYHSAMNEKEDGVEVRKKYRLRIYDYDASYGKLECKHKFDRYIFKESVNLNKEEIALLIKGDISFLLNRNEQIAKEFYFDYNCKLLRPCIVVDYDREAFIDDVGNVRITFDKHIRCCSPTIDLADANASSYEIQPMDLLVLEIKFTEVLPEYIRQLLHVKNFTPQAYSKFYLCNEYFKEVR